MSEANLNITVTLRTEWRAIEPDGEPCAICGDPIYLKAWRLFAYFGETLLAKSINLVCDSCVDVLKERA